MGLGVLCQRHVMSSAEPSCTVQLQKSNTKICDLTCNNFSKYCGLLFIGYNLKKKKREGEGDKVDGIV